MVKNHLSERVLRVIREAMIVILMGFVISYGSFYRIFENFSVGFPPEILLAIFSFLLGFSFRLRDFLIISVISPIFSFFLLQVIVFSVFKNFQTFQILSTVVAKGSALFGLFSMLISI
ncbi:MAG TPA: hypothetical protein PK390_06840, partial [Fervidobacterium nodosum]|nr:hypothetical protein [Fervidobacterium nodosum]